MKKFVYLAGPVLGKTAAEATSWRQRMADTLAPHGIVGISPVRCEPADVSGVYLPQHNDERFGTPRAIMNKNMFDVKACDMIVAYLPFVRPMLTTHLDGRVTMPHHSWGTIVEFSWAHALGKPAILVSDDPEIKEHAVLNGQAGWVLDTLDEATDVLIGILGGYTGGKSI